MGIVKVSIANATLISHTHIIHGINDLNKTNHAWMEPATSKYDVQGPTFFHQVCLLHIWMDDVWKLVQTSSCLFFLHILISLKKTSFNIVGHGMDLIMKVLSPCFETLAICTFMIVNLMMRRPMKIALKSHGLLTCVDLWHQLKLH